MNRRSRVPHSELFSVWGPPKESDRRLDFADGACLGKSFRFGAPLVGIGPKGAMSHSQQRRRVTSSPNEHIESTRTVRVSGPRRSDRSTCAGQGGKASPMPDEVGREMTLPGTHMVTWMAPPVCSGWNMAILSGPGHPCNHVSSRECRV